ncbi:MAG TPA: sigma-70 family RNA polymerase sigma factor [Candidatus Acidoferrales bacterium]|nr:sigma-70 family RNA polymerase sigma factor [Candidatus Acidoferrales bacterium]
MESQFELAPAEEREIRSGQRRVRSLTREGFQHGKTGEKALSDEGALIRAIGHGDEHAFEALFRRYSRKVFQIAYRLIGCQDEAEEAVQEVFLTIFQKAKTFRGECQFSTWLYRLAVNAALSRLRKQKRRKEVSYEDFLPQFQQDGHHKARPVIDWSSDADESAASENLRDALRNAVSELKPVDRAVIVLSDIQGLSDQEIAESLKLTVSAVKTRLHRARLFLRGKLAVHLGYSAA